MSAAWLTALGALIAAFSGLVAWGVRHAWRFIVRLMRFLDDFFGEPARDGLPARPGVMARVTAIEKSMADVPPAMEEMHRAVTQILAETRPNGGTSLRDAVNRVARDVGELRTRMEQLERNRANREGEP